MKELRRVALPVYVVAFILILFPALDLLQAASPIKLGDVVWRAAVAGVVSRVILTPILGLLFIYAAALLLEQRRLLKVLSVFNIVLALAIIVGTGAFAMDALEMRTLLIPDARSNYDLGLIISFAKLGVAVLVLVFFAVIHWKAGSALTRALRRSTSEASPMMVRRAGRPTSVEAETMPAPGAQLVDRE